MEESLTQPRPLYPMPGLRVDKQSRDLLVNCLVIDEAWLCQINMQPSAALKKS